MISSPASPMVFNSLHFAAFFLVVGSIVIFLRRAVTARNAVLLAAGYYFYGWWDWRFLGLLAGTTLFDFFCGRLLGDGRRDESGAVVRGPGDRAFLAASVIVNLTVLGFFKYFNFFIDSTAILLAGFHLDPHLPLLRVVLPVGISFYTFQSMSYIIDVYRGRLNCERNLLAYATFVAFFPPLVAGPIERAAHLLPQMKRPGDVTWDRICTGTYLIGWGLFKKVVIADNVAGVADEIFGRFLPDSLLFNGPGALHAGGTAWLGMYAFAIQIYCDFSGYTDMARGVARVMGFELSLNFDLPYFSTSPADFWRRWHISLSSWLRDYLYIPLGGNRRGGARTYLNLMLTMLLGGLWHGAAWTFVVWGAYQGFLLCVHRATHPLLARLLPARFASSFGWTIIRAVLMFHVVCVGWLVFRAETIGQAWIMFRTAFTSTAFAPLAPPLALTLVATATILLFVQLGQAWTGEALVALRLPLPFRAVAYAAVLLGIIVFGVTSGRPFIYFQF